MSYIDRISEIERRAQAVGMTTVDLCAAVPTISVATFYRWKKPDANPRMRDLLQALDQMESILAERERRIVIEVAARAPQVVLDALSAAKAPAVA